LRSGARSVRGTGRLRKIEEVAGVVEESSIEGRVVVEEGAVVRRSVVRGPSYIGRGSVVEESYVGPYTSVGEGCRLVRVEVENSVLMDRVELSDLGVRVFNSLIGSDAVVSGGEGRPRGLRLILGERSGVELRA